MILIPLIPVWYILQVRRYYSLFADQMDIGTHSGSGSGTGYFIALGDGCQSGTGSVPGDHA